MFVPCNRSACGCPSPEHGDNAGLRCCDGVCDSCVSVDANRTAKHTIGNPDSAFLFGADTVGQYTLSIQPEGIQIFPYTIEDQSTGYGLLRFPAKFSSNLTCPVVSPLDVDAQRACPSHETADDLHQLAPTRIAAGMARDCRSRMCIAQSQAHHRPIPRKLAFRMVSSRDTVDDGCPGKRR
jgi:hypothetical protein